MEVTSKRPHSYAFLLLYLQGLIQGIGFTTIPAAGNFLMSSQGFHLTSAQYGSLFVPMVIGAIFSSLLAGAVGKRFGLRNVLLTAGMFNTVGMVLLAMLSTPIGEPYSMLLVIMFLLGTAFGANITALNPFVIYYFPKAENTAVTALHSCLGIGTALGPILFSLFFHFGVWWGDAVAIASAYFVLLVGSLLFLPSHVVLQSSTSDSSSEKKSSTWLLIGFVVIALLYGIIETTYGNWAGIFLHQERDLSVVVSNNALALFWAMVTCGRILTAIVSVKISVRGIYCFLPVILLLSILAIHFIEGSAVAYLAFGIAGLGCSAFLPLTVSFSTEQFLSKASLVSGLIIASYMTGYAISSWGIGLLHKDWLVSFSSVYLFLAIPIVLLGGFCLVATRNSK